MPVPHLVQVKITKRFAGRRVLGLLHRLFKFFGKNVFLMRLLKERIGKLILALPALLRKDPLRIVQVHIGSRFDRRLVRQHRAKHRVHHQLRLAARARHG